MDLTHLPSVWIVDDDEDDLLFIQSAFLRGTPAIQTLLLNDSSLLLARLDTCADLPKLILLDVNMPRLNGLELLVQLRSRPEYAHLPVVMLTTSSHSRDQQQAFSLGANAFLTKPVSQHCLSHIAQSLSQQWVLT